MNTFHKFFNLCIIVFLIIHVNKAYTENRVATAPEGLIATGHDSRIDLKWNPVNNCSGYNVYRASSSTGPFTRLNASPYKLSVFSDFFGRNNKTYYYYVTSISGTESQPSATVSATSYAMTDEEYLTIHGSFSFLFDDETNGEIDISFIEENGNLKVTVEGTWSWEVIEVYNCCLPQSAAQDPA